MVLFEGIADFENCPLSKWDATYLGQAGTKDGVIYNGRNWMVKYAKSTNGMDTEGISYTTSPLSEYIGSHIYQILGFDTHDTRMVIRNGKLAVACRDFREEGDILLEIRALKNKENPVLQDELDRRFSETGSSHLVNLEELMLHMEKNVAMSHIAGLKERFWDCAIIDILINNNDRNNGNWGIIRTAMGEEKLAPVYDNGDCFSNKASDKRLEYLLSSDINIKNSALNTTTCFGLNNKALTARKFLELQMEDLQLSVLRNIPVIQKNMEKICSFISSIPTEYQGIPLCSKVRSEFYMRSMECRMENLLLPCYERTIEKNAKVNIQCHRKR